jgi:hypothetical protein
VLANCYCGDVGGINTIYYDQASGRYSRYAECMFLDTWGGQYPDDTIDMCTWPPLQVIPAFVLSKQREIFVQSKKKSVKSLPTPPPQLQKF